MIFYLGVHDMKMFENPCCTYDRWIMVCHSLAFLLMWHYQNVHMTAAIMNSDEMTPENILHFHSCWHDLSLWSGVLTFAAPSSPFFFSVRTAGVLPASTPTQIPLGGCFVGEACGCRRHAAVIYRPLTGPWIPGPKWNSYSYQKHKIPITLGVRAETRKWNRYS